MASWAEFEAAAPDFARRARKLLTTRKHLTMATLHSDGSPRISGTEIQFEAGELRIGSMRGAMKARDLLRDPRIAIHGPTHDPAKSRRWLGEAKLEGRAIPTPKSDQSHTFRIDIESVVITHLNAARDRLVIESWRPERGHSSVERA